MIRGGNDSLSVGLNFLHIIELIESRHTKVEIQRCGDDKLTGVKAEQASDTRMKKRQHSPSDKGGNIMASRWALFQRWLASVKRIVAASQLTDRANLLVVVKFIASYI